MTEDKSNSTKDTNSTSNDSAKASSSSKTATGASKPDLSSSSARKPQTIEGVAKTSETVAAKANKTDTKLDEKAKSPTSKDAASSSSKTTDSKQKSEVPKAVPAKAEKRGGIGLLPAVLMFFIGLPLGVGAGYYAQQSGLLDQFGLGNSSGRSEEIQAVASQANDLQTKLALVESKLALIDRAATKDELAQVTSNIGSISTQVDLNKKTLDGEGLNSILLEPLDQRLSALTNEFEKFQQTVTTAQASGIASTGEANPEALAQAMQAAEAMNDRILRLEEQLSAFNGTVAGVRSEDARIRAQFDQLSEQMQVTLTETAKRNETLKIALADVQADLVRAQEVRDAAIEQVNSKVTTSIDAISDVKQRLSSVQGDLDTTKAAIAAPGSEQAVAQVLSIQYLTDALNAGQDMTSASRLARQAGLSSDKISELEQLSLSGIPTAQELQSSFSTLESALLADINKQEDSFMNQLLGSAQNALNIRRTGLPEGDAPEAVVTRIRTYVDGGKINTALEEASKLPESAQTLMGGWSEMAARHVSAQDILKQLENTASGS